MKPDFLAILACPKTKEPLQEASEEMLRLLNEAGQTLKHIDGTQVALPINQALYAPDAKKMYIVKGEVPILLEEKAIDCSDIL